LSPLRLRSLAVILIFLAACSSSQRRAPDENTAYISSLSQFLSGNSIQSGSPYYQLSQLPYYKKHSEDMNQLWNTIEKENYGPIRKWETANLKEKSKKIREVFYPFSGADFVNLYGFYPNAKKYIMVALEKPGKISDPLNLNSGQVKQSLQSLRILISEISRRNYFQRRIMKQEFKNPHFSGVLPALIIFMTRIGLEVEEISDIILNDEGKVIPRPTKVTAKNPEGVKISFYDPKSNESKELVYLSIMLNENSHSQTSAEGKFFQKMEDFGVLMKSAEYLFPRINLNGMRDLILQNSKIVIQDDSGIPFSFFSEAEWNAQLFGKYQKPALLTGVPVQSVQSTLKEKYFRESIPLDFSFGYGVLRGKFESNLMLLIKKK